MTKAHRTLQRDDVQLAVTDWGGDGPPIIFVHGLSGKQQDWDPVATRMADRCRVITYDHRCHGSSSWNADHSWSALVADLDALLNDLELHGVTLVGHSIGAGIALAVSVGNDNCRTLAMLDGAFPVPEPGPQGGRVHLFLRGLKMLLKDPFRRVHALSSSALREVGNDYRSRYAEFDLALRAVDCPATLILGSQREQGRQGPAFQVARQDAAARVRHSNPRIEVQWIEARHDMVQTQPGAICDALVRLLALG